jgi:hypothetical protein
VVKSILCIAVSFSQSRICPLRELGRRNFTVILLISEVLVIFPTKSRATFNLIPTFAMCIPLYERALGFNGLCINIFYMLILPLMALRCRNPSERGKLYLIYLQAHYFIGQKTGPIRLFYSLLTGRDWSLPDD